MAHIIINPTFHLLSDFIQSLPMVFDSEGELVYDERNQIRLFMVDGKKLVVKRFKRPMFHQRLDYTLIRPSKAKRAYLFGMKLVELGISTPTPIACIDHVRPTLKHIVSRYAALRGWEEEEAIAVVIRKLERFEQRKKMLKLHR